MAPKITIRNIGNTQKLYFSLESRKSWRSIYKVLVNQFTERDEVFLCKQRVRTIFITESICQVRTQTRTGLGLPKEKPTNILMAAHRQVESESPSTDTVLFISQF